MKACIIGSRKQLVVKDVPFPVREAPDDVIIKVSHVGICGSDVHMWDSDDKIGQIMGHEFSGTVEDPGSSCFKVGERVTAFPKSSKGYIYTPSLFTPGAYAEYYKSEGQFVYRLPENVDDVCGAMMEPSSVSYLACKKSGITTGDRVLVIGAGIIGLLCAEWARAMGASYVAVTEANDGRIAQAEALSPADAVFDAKDPDVKSRLLSAVPLGTFSKVLECSNASEGPVNLGIDVLGDSGVFCLVGLGPADKRVPVDLFKISFLNARVESLFGSFDGFEDTIRILGMGAFDPSKYATATIGLDDMQAMFEDLHSGHSKQIKVMVKP